MELRAPLPTKFAVIAMGRYGGHESGFGSDADVIFVHDPIDPEAGPAAERRASDAAQAVGTELRRLLSLPAPDPPLLVDADLRPEGRQGPLVRSLAACRAYYERRAAPWEFQALLRAEFAVGSAELGAEFIALADRFRYPAGGWPIPPCAKSAGSRRASRRSGSRAAPTGRCTSSSARAACPTSSGRCSCSSSSTATPSKGCAPPAPWPRSPRRSRPAWSPPPTRPR